ncbi:hypothetical protein BC629DRAFT_1595481 [Irpex lacteus]|nr:hypothetical protein BC629DRAFT_1595481 [Irpex lacteus]
MKTTLALTLLASALSVFAQNAHVALPAQGSDVTRGTNITVQVTKPNSLTGSTSVGVALGLRSCPSSSSNATSSSPSCQEFSSSDIFGYVLYSGAFNPAYHEPSLPPYENFTVYVPAGFGQGDAVLSVAHLVLVGAGPEAILDVSNTTVNVV